MSAEIHFDDGMIECPECALKLPETDFAGQAAHMEREHPEVIAERRAHAARFDGWEND